ncbi:unnamed protein product [Mytilus coruscus]|uniref:Uncharacterized protein n=1 Tax=Mytilus coruscus TaxID=42192 RepID=A0A6J8D6Y3_MYTCO|nr:unnamed protein product [Mytilus coruscus]
MLTDIASRALKDVEYKVNENEKTYREEQGMCNVLEWGGEGWHTIFGFSSCSHRHGPPTPVIQQAGVVENQVPQAKVVEDQVEVVEDQVHQVDVVEEVHQVEVVEDQVHQFDVVEVHQVEVVEEQEPEGTPLLSPVRRIVAREKELEEEQQPDEFVFDQTNTTSTTHPAEEWNMVPTSNSDLKSKSLSSSSSSSACSHKVLQEKLTVYKYRYNKNENNAERSCKIDKSGNWTTVCCPMPKSRYQTHKYFPKPTITKETDIRHTVQAKEEALHPCRAILEETEL